MTNATETALPSLTTLGQYIKGPEYFDIGQCERKAIG